MKRILLLVFLVLTITLTPNSFAVNSFSASSVRTVYTGSNVTTTTALQIVASMPYAVSSITDFDNSGQTMQIRVLTSGGITTSILIPPGGGSFPLTISQGDSVSIIAISGTPANATENDINFFY